jgi:hypothetical protein
LERWVLTGGVMAGDAVELASEAASNDSQMSVTPGEALDLASEAASSDSQMSVTPGDELPRLRRGVGKVAIRLEMSAELAEQWRDLEQRFRRSSLPGSFVAFLCVATLRSWSHVFDSKEAYSHIYAREGFRCKSPVCTDRKLTPHHLRFRSLGGSDDDDNLAGLCLWCHLEGIHGGRIRATPPASNIHWTIGRDPVLEVQHRRRMQVASAEAM